MNDNKSKQTQAKRNGVIGTGIFHTILILLLVFSGFSRIVPDEEEGLAVAMGTDLDGGDDLFEPTPASEVEGSSEPVDNTPSEPEPVEEDLQTQNIEESIAANEAKKKEEDRKKKEQKEKILAEKKKKEEEEQKRKKKEEEERRKEERRKEEEKRKLAESIGSKMSNVFGQKGNGGEGNAQQSSGQGNGQGSGQAGSVNGASGNPQSKGNAKRGNNNSWSLDGRSINGQMVLPQYNAQEEGTVVVNIIVDKNGNVIQAQIGVGTNTDNKSLRDAAIDAAKKTHFNPIKGERNQSGTITYRFDLK